MTDRMLRTAAASAAALAVAVLAACSAVEAPGGGDRVAGPRDRAAAVHDVAEASARLQELLLEVGGLSDLADEVTSLAAHSDRLLETVDVAPVAESRTGTSPAIEFASARRRTATAEDAPISSLGVSLGLLQLPTVARGALSAAENGEPQLGEDLSETVDGGEIALGMRSKFADGRLTAESTSRMTGPNGTPLVSWETKADLLACPAPGGEVTGTLTFDVRTSAKTGEVVYGGTLRIVVVVTARVDDDARVASLELDVDGSLNELASGPDGTSGAYLDGGGTLTADDVSAGDFDYTVDGGIRRASRDATDAQQELFVRSMSEVAAGLGRIVLDDVERFFRGGTCIDVIVDPGPESFAEPGQTLDQDITAVSTSDGAGVEGRASAEPADDGASVDPSGTLAPTPARVVVTGPDDSGESGTVRYEFVSNRGIGTLELVYRVSDAWILDFTEQGVRYTAAKCGGPEGEWTVRRFGVPDGNGGSLDGTIVFDLDPLGHIGYFTETSTLAFGGDVLYGTWSGMASFERVDDETAILDLDYESGTVRYEGMQETAASVVDLPPMELRRGSADDCDQGKARS
ncbi:hypothetical protein ET445_02160 [Agromyces protaetiae]|uniref:Uncharacterized protein n=1 Tax=Agromyces protaetiae TaxID=2509455 RepID=A0A4P6FPA9_9MICO|nr:hypothetical protein [Agromyces protaetiae]QAY72318.1 hypothetical protein ET445_02160 [Agromyces protaetiae]